ncbi:MAG: AMP-binding protein, partial [bacterium]|nr:AMP-binding protein [bacterium]
MNLEHFDFEPSFTLRDFDIRISDFQISPANLAYIIYTSGSTGRPKGNLTTHHNVIRVVRETNYIHLTPGDRILQLSNYAFDGSVFDIYGALLNGSALVMIQKEEIMEVDRLAALIEREKISVFFVTTALFNALIDIKIQCFRNIRKVLFGGERVSVEHTKRLLETIGKDKILHVYGPTESTVYAAYYPVNEIGKNAITVPIGKPLSGTTLYVLDKAERLAPVGVFGELYIGGRGIARGYLNNPEITAERFTRNKVSLLGDEISPLRNKISLRRNKVSVMGNIVYKTGDLVRWLPGGNIEFLGREDHQVKVRGHRIELGEIEHCLAGCEGVKESFIIAREMTASGKRDISLCAYVVPVQGDIVGNNQDSESVTLSYLKEYLSRRLPGYMVPPYFVLLERMPLTANGKIDLGALPDPREMSLAGGGEYAPPRNTLEKQMVQLWREVLDKQTVGINDNFFLTGGDSIKSIRIVSGMRDAGYQIHMKDIFSYPTISQLSPRVGKLERIASQEPVTGPVTLTPIQQWFFSGSSVDLHHFNQAVMFYSAEGFDEEAIKAVFTKIQLHHDALRMSYKYKKSKNRKSKNKTVKILQTGHGPDYPFSLQVFDLRSPGHEDGAAQFEAAVHRLQSGIDLETGPLMKLGLIHLDDGDRLLIVIHHLVIDGVSWRILLEDIDTSMRQYKNRRPLELPMKSDSFKLWAEALSHYAASPGFLKEKSYWRELESIGTPWIEKDFQQEENDVKDTGTVSFRLSKAETDRLLTKVNQAFSTEINDILLTALALGIKETWGHRRVLIDVEGHGREEILEDVDISRTVGWFTSVYPVLLDVSYDDDPGRQVKEIKEILRQVPNKGIGYGIIRYLTPKSHKKEMDFALHPQVGFNYLGQFGRDVNRVSFELAREPVGNMQSPERPRQHELEVSGILGAGFLSIGISFNKNQYKTKTIKRLLSHFQSQLSRLITFCASKEAKELTPSDFTYNRLSIETVDRLNRQYPIQDLYTLSPMQEGMLFHRLYDHSSSSYFEQISYRLQGDLDIAIVEKSLNELFKRHSILRTAFVHEGLDRPLQIVLRDRVIDFYYEDISRMSPSEEKEKCIKEFKENDKQRSFDLGKDTLMRVSVFKTAPGEYALTWSFHHVLMDGWCIGILNAEFFEIYNSFREDRPFRLPPVQPYANYIKWLEKQDKEVSANYWSNYLDAYEELTGVPRFNADAPRTQGGDYENEQVELILDRETTHCLNECAGRNQVTLNTVFQAAWGIILGKYNRREDIVFGAVVSGRPAALEGIDSMMGLFINTVPVRIRFEDNPRFNRLLRRVREEAVAGEMHHHYPLADIQAQSMLKQNLLDHILVFENYPVAKQIQGVGTDSDNNGGHQNQNLVLTNVEIFEQVNYDFSI